MPAALPATHGFAVDQTHNMWCFQPVDMRWCAHQITQSSKVLLKHAHTSLFLQCNEDGTLEMTRSYAGNISCLWMLEPYDADDEITLDSGTSSADSFYLISAHNSVLRISKDDAESKEQVLTVPRGHHFETDVFIARTVSDTVLVKMFGVDSVMAGLEMFVNDVAAFNTDHSRTLRNEDGSPTESYTTITELFADKAQWPTLRAREQTRELIEGMQTLMDTHASRLLGRLRLMMLALLPDCNPELSTAEIVDYIGEPDPEFVGIAGDMGLVQSIVAFVKDHLFQTPSVLFGAPHN
jgi:hypothetical protein